MATSDQYTNDMTRLAGQLTTNPLNVQDTPGVQTAPLPIAKPAAVPAAPTGGITSIVGPGSFTPTPTPAATATAGSGSSGGGGGSGDNVPDYTKFLPHLQAAGYTPDQVQDIISRYHATTTKATALSKLPTDLQNVIATYEQEQQPTPVANQSLFNPLAMQMFFSQNIAPYLQNLNKQFQQQGQDMAKNVNVASLPAPYQNIMQQAIQSRQQGMNNMATALSGATVTTPYLDQLNKQLAAAESAQNYDRYVRERSLAYAQYGGLGGLLGGQTGAPVTSSPVAPPTATPGIGTSPATSAAPSAQQIAAISQIIGQGTPVYPTQ